MKKTMPDELKDVILQGLTNLLVLRLRGAPSADTIAATATAWLIALTAKPVAWDAKLDAARMQAAFEVLMGTIEIWPTPAAFYDRLMAIPRPRQEKLEHKPAGGMSPATRALIDGCKKRLRASTANQEEDSNA